MRSPSSVNNGQPGFKLPQHISLSESLAMLHQLKRYLRPAASFRCFQQALVNISIPQTPVRLDRTQASPQLAANCFNASRTINSQAGIATPQAHLSWLLKRVLVLKPDKAIDKLETLFCKSSTFPTGPCIQIHSAASVVAPIHCHPLTTSRPEAGQLTQGHS